VRRHQRPLGIGQICRVAPGSHDLSA
jgi:hypothetical protein